MMIEEEAFEKGKEEGEIQRRAATPETPSHKGRKSS